MVEFKNIEILEEFLIDNLKNGDYNIELYIDRAKDDIFKEICEQGLEDGLHDYELRWYETKTRTTKTLTYNLEWVEEINDDEININYIVEF